MSQYQILIKVKNARIKAIIIVLLFVIMVIAQVGCKKLVEAPSPNNSLTSDNVYTSDATAAAVLTGLYTLISLPDPKNGLSINSISLTSALSSDEMTLYGGAGNANSTLVQFYLNRLSPGLSTSAGGNIWSDLYGRIYTVNLALERLGISNSLTPSVKQQLTGEAKFLRAFFYFYLVNLYGDVPLTTTSDYNINAVLGRSLKSLVFQQIIADLKDAQNLLRDEYVAADAKSSTAERVRPNKWAATALLSRAYLYISEWAKAEAEATLIINNNSKYGLVPLNNVFLKNSNEAIWQLQPVNAGWNTEDARSFILPSTGPTSNLTVSGFYPVYISQQLLNSFEVNDLRKINWVGNVTINNTTYYYPYKYKSATLNSAVVEYLMVLRLGEQYLIRAEARAQQNNISGSQTDLNAIRTRAGLPNTPAASQSTLLTAIQHERQIELLTEWGHRWLDLKRTGNIDGVMTTIVQVKNTTWSTNWQWYPIPAYEIMQDPNLIQNAGY